MIQINIIAHNNSRLQFTLKALEFLSKIKNENKSKVKILICYTNAEDFFIWNKVCRDLSILGLSIYMLCMDISYGKTYMDKIKFFLESECEYSCSMDDDILISNFLWDYIIENISILDDPSNLFISPLISNGIPTVDIFLNDFCNDTDRNNLYEIFKNTEIKNIWGVDYSSLNYHKDDWTLEFYNKVAKISHYYKGIHPVRVSNHAHKELARIICENSNKIIEDNNFRFESYKFPYFCNSFYFIKTETWKRVIYNQNIIRDLYDEVPLNLYREHNDLNMVFVRNGFCVHMAYNTIGVNEQTEIENYFLQNFIPNI
jgi:hypothetical protein